MKLTENFDVAAFTDRADLRAYVHRVLCERDRLDPEQTPITEAVVTRRGKTCGFVFEIEGPRLLRTSAIWSGDECRVLFYDSTGMRFTEVRLSESPTLEDMAQGSKSATATTAPAGAASGAMVAGG